MPVYCFALHNKDGTPVETLGALPLGDDAESVTFAEGVVRDMTRPQRRDCVLRRLDRQHH